MDTSLAKTQKKWQIRGAYKDGKKFAFSILAFDYFEALALGEARGYGRVFDVVLLDGNREQIRNRAQIAWKQHGRT